MPVRVLPLTMTPGMSSPYVATVKVPGVTNVNGGALALAVPLLDGDVLPHATTNAANITEMSNRIRGRMAWCVFNRLL